MKIWCIVLLLYVIGVIVTLLIRKWCDTRSLRQHDRGYQAPVVHHPPEPVDLVIPWVTTDDEDWKEERDVWAVREGMPLLPAKRHTDHGELKYALRGVDKHLPWIRHVILVVHQHKDGSPQVPAWLNTNHPKLRVVTHPQFYGRPQDLPTFNSSAIECHVHHIPNLSHRFLYSNDDFIPLRPLYQSDFQDEKGRIKVFLSDDRVPRGFLGDNSNHTRSLMRQNKLLDKAWGTEDRNYPRHVINMRNRDAEYEKRKFMPDEWKRTSGIRFRSPLDFIDNGFLHPHWYLATNNGVRGALDSVMVRMQSHHPVRNAISSFYESPPKMICFEDDHDEENSTREENLQEMKRLLDHLLPSPSSFEKMGNKEAGV